MKHQPQPQPQHNKTKHWNRSTVDSIQLGKSLTFQQTPTPTPIPTVAFQTMMTNPKKDHRAPMVLGGSHDAHLHQSPHSVMTCCVNEEILGSQAGNISRLFDSIHLLYRKEDPKWKAKMNDQNETPKEWKAIMKNDQNETPI